jgi:Zn-dependent metalloprotease
MIKKLFLFTAILGLALVAKTQIYYSTNAQKIIPGSSLVKINEKTQILSFVKLRDDFIITDEKHQEWLKTSIGLSEDYEFVLNKKVYDKLGYTNYRYKIYYKNIAVEDAVYYVHVYDNKVISANGELYWIQDISENPVLSEESAFDKAQQFVSADKYMWEEKNIQGYTKPKGSLVLLDINGVSKLAYKFDIYATEPLSRKYIYVDATDGKIIKTTDRIETTDVTGTAETKYCGTKTITTDSYGGSYRLRETGRGDGIETYDLNNGTSSGSAVDFTDADNYWNVTTNQDNAAYDAHYSTEMTYDYYLTNFGLNSYDGLGAKMYSYVHYDYNYVNAFWDGTAMWYGDGDGTSYTALTATEVVGHEITHGVTENSAALVYSSESGALNESFSDIFGTVIDFYANPSTANYLMGDQISTSGIPFRSMSNPNQYQCPDTYLGDYWDPFEEVHTNSGVMNFWFYLLTEGGTGVNDNGDSYNVNGIGMDKAAQIAFRTLTSYLTPNSPYSDARLYSIQAATDLFGACSDEVIATTNAWYAVGVGGIFSNSVIANFVASSNFQCSIPATIDFTSTSTNASTYLWDFGDGTTSTTQNPSHTYTSTGIYTVSLIITGSATCGGSSDTLVINNYITITNTGGPISASCTPSTINTTADCGILNFTFNTINSTTIGSPDGYQDYTCSNATTVSEGTLYSISVTTPSLYETNVWIWLDINNDGIFNSTNELIYTSLNTIQSHTGDIVIPPGIVFNTPLRLRIGSDYMSYTLTNGCTNSEYGQYEDYSVTILPNASAPLVDFVADYTNVNIGQNVNFTDLTQNIPTSWYWTFTGGTPPTSTIKNPTVVYNALGSYNVNLVATNSYGADSLIKTSYINVVNTFNMCSATSTTATDGILYDSGGPSGDYDYYENCSFLIDINCAVSITLSFSSFLTESCCDYLRVYDGTNTSGTLLLTAGGSTLPSPVTAYSGSMFITFYSDGSVNYPGFEASWISVIPAGTPPVGNFSIGNTNPPLNTDVSFTDQSTNFPIGWLWDFGDGNFSNSQNPLHAYASPGTFNVTLIVSNCYSSDTVSQSLTVQTAPVIDVDPDSLYITLVSCNDSETVTMTIYNTGSGQLVYDIDGGASSSSTPEVLALTYGVDMSTEYPNTLNAINQYYSNYNLTEINTTSASALQAALAGKNVLLIAEQETGSASVFTGFASVLQTFVNNGGSVIFCGTTNYDCIFYSGLFSGSYGGTVSSGSLNVINNTHPITYQLPATINAQNMNVFLNITNSDAVKLVKYGTSDVVAYREIGDAKIIYAGYDFYIYDTSAAHIIANAMQWAGGSAMPSWITIDPDSGMIVPGDSQIVDVTFYSSGLNSGTYSSTIDVNNNDPLNPQIAVPYILNIIGYPLISLSDTCFDFGDVMLNGTHDDTLLIFNTGCDTLKVSNMNVSAGGFSISTTSLSILPGDSGIVIITFHPTTLGGYNAVLNIFNNASDTSVCLSGMSIPAPIINVDPDQYSLSLDACGDSITIPLYISNTGGSNLTFDIEGGSSATPEVLALTYGVDMATEYPNTLDAINQYYSNYNLTEINTTSASALQAALAGKNVLFIAEQETGSVSVFTGFASVLQTFVNNGGSVIFCGTSNYNCIFNTGLFSGSYGGWTASGSLNVIDNTHPITYQLPVTINAQDMTTYLSITNSDAVKLVKYSTYDVVAYREIGDAKIIYAGYDFYSYDTSAAHIIANAVQWAGGGSLPSWISLTPDNGTVSMGDSQTVYVTFSSDGLSGGTYYSEITINSNDPVNPEIIVPCTLQVSFNVCANFNYSISLCSGIVDFTDATINNPDSWSWDFGDGSFSSLQNPSHTYSSAGSFDVTLIACNAYGCDTILDTILINNINGPVSASCTPGTINYTSGIGILNVTFNSINNTTNDGSDGYMDYSCTQSTTVTMGQTYSLSVQTGYTYSENASAWIDYNNNGIFETSEQVLSSLNSFYHTANVTVSNMAMIGIPLRMRIGSDYSGVTPPSPCIDVEYGQFEDYSVIIQPNTLPPLALFTGNILDECQGIVYFNNQSANGPTSAWWDFGDGTTSSYMNPYHTYALAGTYTVTLTVSNPYGTDTYTSTITIHSLNPDIAADSILLAGYPVYFYTNTQGATTWYWDFGDGDTSYLQFPVHVYDSNGIYTVTLLVTNSYGCSASTSANIIIGTVSLPDINEQHVFLLYPNPNNGTFTLVYEAVENENLNIEIRNVMGQIIYSEKINDMKELKKEISLINKNKGIYFLILTTGHQRLVQKIIID